MIILEMIKSVSYTHLDVYKRQDEPTGALDSKSARQLLETFEHLNQKLGATILMVTHDAFTARYAERIIFIKDGKIFNELVKGEDTRKQFFEKIIVVQSRAPKTISDLADLRGFLLRLRNSCCRILNPIFLN